MTGESKPDRLLSRGNEIGEIRDLKREFQEELEDKDAAEARARTKFIESYIDEEMYMCGKYPEYYEDGILLAERAEYIGSYDLLELCLDPTNDDQWICYEDTVPESVLIKDRCTKTTNPKLWREVNESEEPAEVIKRFDPRYVIVETASYNPDGYRAYEVEEVTATSIHGAMDPNELSLHLTDGSDFLQHFV